MISAFDRIDAKHRVKKPLALECLDESCTSGIDVATRYDLPDPWQIPMCKACWQCRSHEIAMTRPCDV